MSAADILQVSPTRSTLREDCRGDDHAAAMGEKCSLPVKQLGSRPGSLGSFVGVSLGKPIITWELPADAPLDGDALWKTYGEVLVVAGWSEKEPSN